MSEPTKPRCPNAGCVGTVFEITALHIVKSKSDAPNLEAVTCVACGRVLHVIDSGAAEDLHRLRHAVQGIQDYLQEVELRFTTTKS